VKAYNYDTNEITFHKSMYSAGKQLNVDGGSIRHVCNKKYGCEHAYSRDAKEKYTFEYISNHEYQRLTSMADKKDDKITVRINSQDLY